MSRRKRGDKPGPALPGADVAAPGPPVLMPDEEPPVAAAPSSAGDSMSSRVAKGASWSAFGRLGSQVLQFVVGLVLARLLFPEDFGLMASVYVITGLTVIFFDMGILGALVHRRELTEKVMATAFWFNALGGLLLLLILVAAGPYVAGFYGDERLRWLTPLAGLAFVLSLSVVHSALLQRALRFRPLALTEISAAVGGNAVIIATAALGWGPYALITGPPAQSVITTVVLWRMTRWRPRHFFSPGAFRQLWAFSGGMLGFSLVNYAGRNTDNLLIGRFIGATDLGLYNRAYNLMLLPLQQVGGVLGRVMFPALASMGDDRSRVSAAYRRALRAMTLITMPFLIGMAATAPALVTVLWGERWVGTVPLLQLLCLAGLPQIFGSSEGWLYQSQGRTALMFKMGLLTTTVNVIAIVIGLQFGVIGVAAGLMISAYVFLPINLYVACRTVGLASWRVYADNARTVLASIIMGACVYATPMLLDAPRSTHWLLPLQVLVGVVIYLALCLLFQRQLLRDVRSLRHRRHS